MTVEELIEKLRTDPNSVEFEEVMRTIDENYHYTPTRFTNGDVENAAGSNEGSCKIFYFAQLNNLSETETLSLFGRYYRDDVMGDPAGDDHPNIRNFILDGWLGVHFDGEALQRKHLPRQLLH